MNKFHSAKIIGVISDTHNLLRPEALEALKNSKLIIHAGDIGDQYILDELEKIALTIAVRGNVDQATWCEKSRDSLKINVGEIEIFVIHNLKEFDAGKLSEKVKVVVSGHSHKPSIEVKNGILYLNPGSAGRRRFKLPISLAKLTIEGTEVKAKIIELPV